MMQDSLASALGTLKGTRMDDVAGDEVRRRLEQAWAERATRRRARFVVPGFARAFAIAVLVMAAAFTTIQADADNPLYGARVAFEDSLVAFQSDPVAYLSQLYTERLEEAARFEATGNALAASRARDAQSTALRLLHQISADPAPSPEPSATFAITLPTLTASPETSATPTESPTPTPTASPRPTIARTPTPKPATPKPTAKPTVTPAPTLTKVHATGFVLYNDGTLVDGACVSTAIDGACVAKSAGGRIDMYLTAKKGQSITLYVRNYDAVRGMTLRGKVTVTVSGSEVNLGTVTLR
jgi:hypothetical protein